MKTLILVLFTSSLLAAGLDLEVAKLSISQKYNEARELSHYGYSEYTIYSSELTDSKEESVYEAISKEYTGYNAPIKYIDVKEVSGAEFDSTIEASFSNLSKKNGAGAALESLKQELVDLALNSKLTVFKIEHEGGFSGCKETALVDSQAKKVLVFGSCWSE